MPWVGQPLHETILDRVMYEINDNVLRGNKMSLGLKNNIWMGMNMPEVARGAVRRSVANEIYATPPERD